MLKMWESSWTQSTALPNKTCHVSQEPKNVTYLSPDVQNLIIQIIDKMISGIICDEVRQSGYFSLMENEIKI